MWETRYYVTDTNKPGPVVMIVGGVHGNEPGGARAAEHIRHWPITKGKLIVHKKFILKGPPVNGSLARAAAERLKIKSMILETTYKDQPISRRARQHRIMVHRFLSDLAMVSISPDVLVSDGRPENAIFVAVYDAGGVGAKGPGNLEHDLCPIPNIVLRRVGVPEITGAVLKAFDVLILTATQGSKGIV